jgi:hypothetical protein
MKAKSQEELDKYNEMIKQENLKYESFNNLYDQIILFHMQFLFL